MPWMYVSATGNDRNGRPVTYRHTGPLLDFLPLWFWVEDNLGRKVDRVSNLATLFPWVTYETVLRWTHKGVRLATARQLANHFGVTPCDIWPDYPDWAQP